jgi:hypothetical protein
MSVAGMDRGQLISLYDRDQRIAVRYPDCRREVLPNLVRHVSTSMGGEGMVIYSRLDERTADTVIDEQVAYFQRVGQDFEWKLYDYDMPADLMARLAARGFEIAPAEAIMVLSSKQVPELLTRSGGHSVRQIRDATGLRDVVAIKEAVWEEERAWLGQYLETALSSEPGRMSIYIVSVEGKAACAGWIYFPEGSQFASLWGGSTLQEYRNRGLYTTLLAVRVQEALRRGVSFLTVDASPMSQPILERFGFVKIADSVPCKWKIQR